MILNGIFLDFLMNKLENLVDNFISLEPEKHFNESECREYFYNYKEEFDEAVLSSIGRATDDVFQKSFLMIGELLHAAHEKKRTLSDLRVQAKECKAFDCNDVSSRRYPVGTSLDCNPLNSINTSRTLFCLLWNATHLIRTCRYKVPGTVK